MKMIRYNDPTSAVLRSLESVFPAFSGGLSPFFSPGTVAQRRRDTTVEWYEDDDHFYALVELPGVKKESLNLHAEDGVVHFSFERTRGHGEASRTESFERFLRTPEGTNLAEIEAKLEAGVLTLTIPKQPELKPVTIEVK